LRNNGSETSKKRRKITVQGAPAKTGSGNMADTTSTRPIIFYYSILYPVPLLTFLTFDDCQLTVREKPLDCTRRRRINTVSQNCRLLLGQPVRKTKKNSKSKERVRTGPQGIINQSAVYSPNNNIGALVTGPKIYAS